MRYDKHPLSFEEQADLLISRGLVVEKSILMNRLKNVNYYRLSGYVFPYRQDDDSLCPGTTFETIWRHYTFDRRLRLIVMDAIERVEISVRTRLIYSFAHATGAFGYVDKGTFPHLSSEDHQRLMSHIFHETDRSGEKFVQHFRQKYGSDHRNLPLWMAGEIMSFGCTLTMYRGVSDDIKKAIADYYGMPDEVMTSWLITINVIRNICAHHGRLWNKILGVKPYIPRKKKYPQWHKPVMIPQDRIFGVLTILRYLLQIIAPQSWWTSSLFMLLDEYSEISIQSMGFPEQWRESPLWK